MRVEQVMTPQVRFCRPEDSLDHTAQLMWRYDCGFVPVCAGDGASGPVGVITDRDICMCAMFRGLPLSQLTVGEAIADQRQVYVCQLDDSLAEAEELMRRARVRRLPVIDGSGALVGVISLADLAREASRQQDLADKEISDSEVHETLAHICAPPVSADAVGAPTP
jgi:CBS domain-containing protein